MIFIRMHLCYKDNTLKNYVLHLCKLLNLLTAKGKTNKNYKIKAIFGNFTFLLELSTLI